MSVLVCLPCYNEELSLPPLLEKLALLADDCDETVRVIAVDDGSADATRRVLEDASAAAAENDAPSLTVVVHEANRGLGPAILTGLETALENSEDDDDIVVCMDADDTHDPAYVPTMLARVRAGADLVIASRYQEGSREVGVPGRRRLLSKGARLIFRLLLPIPGVRDYTCGFRAYRVALLRKAMETYGDGLIRRSGFACTDEILIKLSVLTEKIEEIPFVLRYDQKQSPSSLPLLTTILATLKLIQRGRALRKQARK